MSINKANLKASFVREEDNINVSLTKNLVKII